MNELMDEWMWKQDAERSYIKTKRANIITRWIKLASRQWVLLVWTEMTDTIGFVEPVLNGADTRMEEKGGGSQTELLIAAANPDCRRTAGDTTTCGADGVGPSACTALQD